MEKREEGRSDEERRGEEMRRGEIRGEERKGRDGRREESLLVRHWYTIPSLMLCQEAFF